MILGRAFPFAAASLVALATVAHAQPAPTPFPGAGGGGPGGGGEDQKPAGVAEAAPKTPGLLPTAPTLPPPKSHRKRLQLLTMDGYLRFRTNWFKNFNLGFLDNDGLGGAPFARSLGCATAGAPCSNSLKSANMRVRLEPTINIDETTSVHMQIDVLDNVVLGSTPTGTYLNGAGASGDIPLGAFSNGQSPPVAGLNSASDAIAVKRAWAEVATPLGLLRFGRMPDHWGTGMMHNGGGEDPMTGDYNLDGDHGDTVDRLSFAALIPGTRLRAMIATDWPLTRLISSQVAGDTTRQGGQAFDLDDNDDVSQWSLVVSRLDTPTEYQDTLERGALALNYGAYVSQRKQDWDYDMSGVTLGATTDPLKYIRRTYAAYVLDPWVKAGYKDWEFEAEAVAVLGSVAHIADLCADRADTEPKCATGSVNIRQFGGLARASYKALNDKLKIGVETGYASGDQYDSQARNADGKYVTVPGRINVDNAQLLPNAGDNSISQFMFDKDYRIDLILFKELMGAVSNAIYVKPRLEYQLSKSFRFRIANITSFAARAVATPGNASMYGTEFDGDLGYSSNAFFAGISYGVLFPLGALAHPVDSTATQTYGTGNTGDGSTAHTIQTRLVLKF